ncbi:hypothetical protein [Paraburkholderia heleia]|uniref:hypothetical protein n=1 Tax=Paraburkholderia heleia TaxID=634127 RepID=UPI001FE08255|nr:hypothetical protein [Paraburkholderia heleia]
MQFLAESRRVEPALAVLAADFARGNGAFAADYRGVTNAATGAVDRIGRTNNVGVAVGMRQMF